MVAAGHCIDGVFTGRGEPHLNGGMLRLTGDRRTCHGRCSQGRQRSTRIPVDEALHVTQHGLSVRQQLMSKGNGLGLLEVGEARADGFDMLFSLLNQGVLQVQNLRCQLAGVVT
ncbi:hypothetical protein D3C79_518340 [compost metagenome]